jgi:hypothetical protein
MSPFSRTFPGTASFMVEHSTCLLTAPNSPYGFFAPGWSMTSVHHAVQPPSTQRVWQLTIAASLLAKKLTAYATSLGSASLPIGIFPSTNFRNSSC